MSSFYICAAKIFHQTMYGSWDMVCDGNYVRIDGQKKWHIDLGASPKNQHVQ